MKYDDITKIQSAVKKWVIDAGEKAALLDVLEAERVKVKAAAAKKTATKKVPAKKKVFGKKK